MAPTLYAIAASPAVRSVFLCAKAVELDLNIKEVNLLEGEHLKSEYLKLNPQHTVPLLEDEGFILADSHAIMTYLVAKYGRDSSLYPRDLRERALIDHKLHFDSSILFVRGLIIAKGLFFEGDTAINPKHLAALEEAYSITETFLEKTPYIAGDHLTVADFSCLTSITSWNPILSFNEAKYPRIASWIKKLEQLPYYKEANQVGLDQYIGFLKTCLDKIGTK